MISTPPIRPRGFTLIEVLIATFVIALGTIGLIALFAGAASQQRVASQTTVSVIVSKNAEAIISPRFGRLEGTLFDGDPFTGFRDRGVWWPVAADSQGNLSINPDATTVAQRDRAYFLLERNEPSVLFDLPENQQWRQQALGRGTYRANGSGPDSQVFNTSPYPVRRFPVGRLDARATGSIQVVTNDQPTPNDPNYSYRGEVTTRFVYVNTNYALGRPQNWPPTPAQFANTGEYALFTPTGGFPGADGSYILVKREEDAASGEPLSFIHSFNILPLVDPSGDGSNERHLQRIIVPRVVHRSAEVISSGDRVIEVRDSDFDAGVRPDIGYSLLYRKLEGGGSQIAVFTYFINGTNRAARFRLQERNQDAPSPFGNDSGSDEWGLRMLGNVPLAYDNERRQYYFLATSDLQINALAPGSVILVSGQPESANNRIAGSDLPVRVVRQVRAPTGNGFRCYINRVPRAGGKSMLPFRNQTQSLDLWTMRDRVRSTDGSEWTLRPREVRIFNVN